MTLLPQNEQDRVLPLVVETTVAVQGPPRQEGGPKYGPPTGPADALVVEPPLRASSSDRRDLLDPDNQAKRDTSAKFEDRRPDLASVYHRSSKHFRDRSADIQPEEDRVQTTRTLPKTESELCPRRRRGHPCCRRHKGKCCNKNRSPIRVHAFGAEDSRRKPTERLSRENIEPRETRNPRECCVPVNQEEPSENRVTENNLSWSSSVSWTNNIVWSNNVASVEPVLLNQGEWIVRCPPYPGNNNIIAPKPHRKITKIIDNSNEAIKGVNKKVLAMAKAMTPTWSLRLLGVSCGSVVCAWGLLLILSVLGGATHNTGIDNFALGTLTEDNINGARCPWACTCRGQELECSHRGLTQVPGDLANLLLAEKL